MQFSLRQFLMMLILATGVVGSITGVTAVGFGQKDVVQSKFIAVAVPLNGNAYKLSILEQISHTKKCWNVSGKNPTKVELLLLKFNFSGICSRNTDSNGYSIRQGGKDLALDYLLKIQNRKQELVLVGVPRLGQQGKVLEIGRTHGIASHKPVQITLNPGWRFARRTFSGKSLGHIYLTRK
jgi:hypothetical protein